MLRIVSCTTPLGRVFDVGDTIVLRERTKRGGEPIVVFRSGWVDKIAETVNDAGERQRKMCLALAVPGGNRLEQRVLSARDEWDTFTTFDNAATAFDTYPKGIKFLTMKPKEAAATLLMILSCRWLNHEHKGTLANWQEFLGTVRPANDASAKLVERTATRIKRALLGDDA